MRAQMKTSKTSLHTVMANQRFSGVTITRGDGTIVEVPCEQIDPKGRIKKKIHARRKALTREYAEYLESKGVKVIVGGGSCL
jgi:hypothetical protein